VGCAGWRAGLLHFCFAERQSHLAQAVLQLVGRRVGQALVHLKAAGHANMKTTTRRPGMLNMYAMVSSVARLSLGGQNEALDT